MPTCGSCKLWEPATERCIIDPHSKGAQVQAHMKSCEAYTSMFPNAEQKFCTCSTGDSEASRHWTEEFRKKTQEKGQRGPQPWIAKTNEPAEPREIAAIAHFLAGRDGNVLIPGRDLKVLLAEIERLNWPSADDREKPPTDRTFCRGCSMLEPTASAHGRSFS